MKNHNTVIIYMPALHKGYLDFLDKYLKSGDALYLIDGEGFSKLEGLEHLQRDVRAIPANIIIELVEQYLNTKNLKYNIPVVIIESPETLNSCIDNRSKVIMPDDDVVAAILNRFPALRSVVTLEKMFLRWDKNASLLEHNVNVPAISENDLPDNVVAELRKQIGKSADWWRQVATVIYDDQNNILLAAYNRHLPNDSALNIFGDPRFNFNPGEHIENCTAIHSEAWAIAQAAREGISLKGLTMLVSDFPCPVCAKSIAYTGIKKLFFVRGYSKIDGQKTLEDAGIQLQKVIFEN